MAAGARTPYVKHPPSKEPRVLRPCLGYCGRMRLSTSGDRICAECQVKQSRMIEPVVSVRGHELGAILEADRRGTY